MYLLLTNYQKALNVLAISSTNTPMTIIRSTDVGVCQLRDSMLQKHWGSTRTVQVYREPGCSLGISIVGGRVRTSPFPFGPNRTFQKSLFQVDLQSSKTTPASETILGIFVKNVVQESPAGKTGMFKVGNIILRVNCVIDVFFTHFRRAIEYLKSEVWIYPT